MKDMLNSIHHIAIICSDKDKALHFYHDLLGFPMIRSNYRPDRNDWKIDLLFVRRSQRPAHRARDVHCPICAAAALLS